ncbi:matrix metalloproteinase 14 precursor [Strongylocentrotus purpuratus]|uniref:Matrix metalloproteinase 14 n=1 Tax=Strongylocentrotus purpuratus TaxID=7668 RepID=Q4G2F4_STRPU|nr:matrix metalloproteinase 14 precursor [Strongylocentrotus purpuratus]AAX59992.1 matrix metalloproteinase 14 [Strongylocentrotus purpuratus]|eukprot:NP_001028823.1 matrix metalloproteinase 14 precursor [Strongylocentrotus purpuratus]
MSSRLVLLALWSFLMVTCCLAQKNRVKNEDQAMAYLNKYGYLDMKGGMPNSEEMKTALEYFQRFANITMTGCLDSETMAMMNTPRCGMVDMDSPADMMRKKRYALGSRWSKTELTYRIINRTPDLPANEVDRIITESIEKWADASGLTFTLVKSGNADILISFAPGSHGDDNPFDGPGGVLAHAYYPSSNAIGGDAHFDEDERYTDASFSGINLEWVAVHEFGHSLGLGHSQIEGAVMYPFYTGYVPKFQLNSDDIAGIQAHYGENVGEPENTPSTPVDKCMTSITLATRTLDGSTYLGNATHLYRRTDGSIPDGYPKVIGDEFPGLPTSLNAALYYPRNGKTYFFKGSQYWRFRNQRMDNGYPRPMSNWRGVPKDISSAFIWSRNGKIYFTKGDEYYRYTPGYGVTSHYPQPLSKWDGLPSHGVDAAFQWTNARTYFFKGSEYYRFNDITESVDDGYPINTATAWL